MLAQINRNVRKRELFLLLCFTAMVSSFLFTAIVPIYQLINPINTGVLEHEITSEARCCAPVRKTFLQMRLPIFLQ